MLQIKVDKNNIIEYKQENGKIFINGEEQELNVSLIGSDTYHITKNNRSFNIEVIDFDKETKTFKLKINDQIVTVEVKDKLDILMEKMGMNESAGVKIADVKAPMPGLILDLKVDEGDEVEAGANLVILEAMKMENIIKSPRKGIIKSIKIKRGQSVEKNQVLLEFAN